MCNPQAGVDRVFEELVVHIVEAGLVEPNRNPFLSRLDRVGLLTRDEELRVPARGKVQYELSP